MCKTKMMFLLVFIALISACSTVKVPIIVKHSSGTDMSSYDSVSVLGITGSLGVEFTDALKEKLVKSRKFKILDSSRINTNVKKLKSHQAKSTGKDKLMKSEILTPDAIIRGHGNGKYKEVRSNYKDECKKYDKDGNEHKYTCTKYSREGTYRTSGGVDVIDTKTGEIIVSKRLNAYYSKTTTATDREPGAIDSDALSISCVNETTSIFSKSIAPWEEVVEVEFKKDSDIPGLEKGIMHVKIEEYKEAHKVFSNAIKTAKNDPDISPKTLAIAYWDIGLLYEYTWEFDKAIKSFKKAYSLNQDDDYVDEISNTKKLKKEKKREEERARKKNKGA